MNGPLITTGGGDGDVLVWDPQTGRQVCPTWTVPLTSDYSDIYTICPVPLPDGRTVLAAGGEGTSLWRWDPATSQPEGRLIATGHRAIFRVVALPLPSGRTVLATSGDDETVELFDAMTGVPLRRGLRRLVLGHPSPLSATCVLSAGGRTMLTTVCEDGDARMWDVATADLVGGPFATGHGTDEAINVVSPVALPGGSERLCTVGRHIRFLDPATGQRVGPAIALPPEAGGHDMAVVTIDGSAVLAIIGRDDAVRLLDPVAGVDWADPIATDHIGQVTSIASLSLPGIGDVLATGGADGTVRLWDPRTRLRIGQPLAGHDDEIFAMAVFRLARDDQSVADRLPAY